MLSTLQEPNIPEGRELSQFQKDIILIDFICSCIFTTEAVLCIFAMGFMEYLKYDAFGFAVVVCAWLEVVAAALSLKMTGFRALRLMRPLLAIQLFTGIMAILRVSQNAT